MSDPPRRGDVIVADFLAEFHGCPVRFLVLDVLSRGCEGDSKICNCSGIDETGRLTTKMLYFPLTIVRVSECPS